MKEKHARDIDIQRYVLKDRVEKADIEAHIQSCPHCKARAEIYRRLFSGIKEQPQPAFDFDLKGLILSQIDQPQPKFSWAAFFTGLLVVVSISAMGWTLFMFRKYFADLFSGFSIMAIYLLITGTLVILLFQGLEMYKKHRRQMDFLKYL